MLHFLAGVAVGAFIGWHFPQPAWLTTLIARIRAIRPGDEP